LNRVSGGAGRESIIVLAYISADGNCIPPFIVFKGAAVQARWAFEKSYPGTIYGVSKNSWMKEPLFFNWFSTLFVKYVEQKRINFETNTTAL